MFNTLPARMFNSIFFTPVVCCGIGLFSLLLFDNQSSCFDYRTRTFLSFQQDDTSAFVYMRTYTHRRTGKAARDIRHLQKTITVFIRALPKTPVGLGSYGFLRYFLPMATHLSVRQKFSENEINVYIVEPAY